MEGGWGKQVRGLKSTLVAVSTKKCREVLNPYTVHLKLIQHCACLHVTEKEESPRQLPGSLGGSLGRRRRAGAEAAPPRPLPGPALSPALPGLVVKIGELTRLFATALGCRGF